ncbi:MAG: hypothetical protein KAR44_15045, partial [Candidatus Aegiribacteria sp.]|nr:hypothetical protein [Candidatus Aegiribacteria sp.]
WSPPVEIADAWNYPDDEARCSISNSPCSIGNCPGSHCLDIGRYGLTYGEDWSPPELICPPAGRPEPIEPLIFNGPDYCGIPPVIDSANIKINNQTSGVTITNTGFVNLTFTSNLDSQQLPLTMISINWGDGESTVISGIEMRDRVNMNNPHSFYHLYSYWDLKAKDEEFGSIDCPVGGSRCEVTPSIKIKDNWGWCNNGEDEDPCPYETDGSDYEPFSGIITVNESNS